jgi:hypothetical protein
MRHQGLGGFTILGMVWDFRFGVARGSFNFASRCADFFLSFGDLDGLY